MVAVVSFLPSRFLPESRAEDVNEFYRPVYDFPRRIAKVILLGSSENMSVTTRLDISIGPVQGFVAQSRRTRDLWGSSYLLSFLVAHAMRGARISGGKIIQPVVDEDPLYRWVSGQRDGNVPQLGSLPNHFVVEVEEDVAPSCECRVG